MASYTKTIWTLGDVITQAKARNWEDGLQAVSDAVFGPLWAQPNRIDADMTIPDGFNAVMFGPFEVGPDVTVTGEGNACFRGL